MCDRALRVNVPPGKISSTGAQCKCTRDLSPDSQQHPNGSLQQSGGWSRPRSRVSTTRVELSTVMPRGCGKALASILNSSHRNSHLSFQMFARVSKRGQIVDAARFNRNLSDCRIRQ